jgi:hypothetical protein
MQTIATFINETKKSNNSLQLALSIGAKQTFELHEIDDFAKYGYVSYNAKILVHETVDSIIIKRNSNRFGIAVHYIKNDDGFTGHSQPYATYNDIIKVINKFVKV